MAAFTALAIGLMIAGGAMQVKGHLDAGKAAKKQGEAEQKAAESQADLSEYNAAVADLQAKDATARGEIEANRFRSRTKVLIGEQRAGIAAGNIDVGYGSAVDVQADAAFLGELDALTVRTNAAREAWGFRVDATDQRTRAGIQREEGANAALAGKERQKAERWNAAGSVLNTASALEQRYGFGGKGK